MVTCGLPSIGLLKCELKRRKPVAGKKGYSRRCIVIQALAWARNREGKGTCMSGQLTGMDCSVGGRR